MQHELTLLGLPPDATSNAARAAEIAQEVLASDATFSHPGEPSNAMKIQHIREQFNCPQCGMHDVLPYAAVFLSTDPGKQQAGSFLADLRCQYIKRVLDEGLIPKLVGWMLYTRNRVWYVRMREQVNLFLLAQKHRDEDKQ